MAGYVDTKYAREVASGKFSAWIWIWKKEENKWITTGIKPEKYKLGMYASVVEKNCDPVYDKIQRPKM